MAMVREKTVYSPSDEALLAAYANGSASALNELVQRHATYFYQVAYRITLRREEAEDIVQEAFLKLVDGRARWQDGKGAAFTTWFYTIVHHLAVSSLRRQRPVHLVDETVEDNSLAADVVLAEKQHHQLAARALERLLPRQRAALTLHYYSGLPQKEAAEVMGLSVKGYESLLGRAREQLKKEVHHA